MNKKLKFDAGVEGAFDLMQKSVKANKLMNESMQSL